MAPAQDPEAPAWLTRVVGTIAALIGTGIAAFDGAIVIRQLQLRGTIEEPAAAMVATLTPIAWFCLESGLRLAFNWPSREGSVLSLASWKWLAVAAGSLTLWAATLALRAKSLPLLLIALVLGATVSRLCWSKYRELRFSVTRVAAL